MVVQFQENCNLQKWWINMQTNIMNNAIQILQLVSLEYVIYIILNGVGPCRSASNSDSDIGVKRGTCTRISYCDPTHQSGIQIWTLIDNHFNHSAIHISCIVCKCIVCYFVTSLWSHGKTALGLFGFLQPNIGICYAANKLTYGRFALFIKQIVSSKQKCSKAFSCLGVNI